jgi:DNA repair protein RecN (Recombination protein N)
LLKRLKIGNFAIIDKLDLNFYEGMTVITGETGAGKSILLDAISLLSGERASQDMIRFQEERAFIEGVFELDDKRRRKLFTEFGVTANPELVIERELAVNNKNSVKINGENKTLGDLKNIMRLILDIHSQFDTQRLLNPDTYLELLDNFQPERLERFLNSYQTRLAKLKQTESEYERLKRQKEALESKRDSLSAELTELRQLAFTPDELERLQDEADKLNNFDRVYEQFQLAIETIDGGALETNLYQLHKTLERLGGYSGEYKYLSDKITDHYYELEDLFREIRDKAQDLNFDPEELERLNGRIYLLQRTIEKYGKNLPELCQYIDSLEQLLADANGIDFNLQGQKKQLDEEFSQVVIDAKQLSQARQALAASITLELTTRLHELGLQSTKIEFKFSSAVPETPEAISGFKDDGIDAVDILISTNVGEPLKPLAKTASGGEMSRVMLAFKSIFVGSRQLETMIFDEIDTGISGKVARQIALSIKEIAKKCQVLSITHIPQVAASGDHHLSVRKVVEGGRTIAKAKYLDFSERVNDLAMMLSIGSPTPSTIDAAKELLLET